MGDHADNSWHGLEGVQHGVSDGLKVTLKLKERIHILLNSPDSSPAAKAYNIFMSTCIMISVLMVLLNTIPQNEPVKRGQTQQFQHADNLYTQHLASLSIEQSVAEIIEMFFTFLFMAELAVRFVVSPRLWTLPDGGLVTNSSQRREKSSLRDEFSTSMRNLQESTGSLSSEGDLAQASVIGQTWEDEVPFFRDVYNWLDLIVILPFFIELLPEADGLGSFRIIFSMIRIGRIFKVLRRFRDVEVLLVTIKRVWKPLLLPIVFLIIFAFVFGSLLYLLDPCFDHTSCAFKDVSTSAYFVIVTMTTVGYGDQIPTKIEAMVLTGIMMLFGSVFLSMPLSVIGAEFDLVWQEKEKQDKERAERGVDQAMASYRQTAVAETTASAEEQATSNKPVNLGRYYLVDEYIKICESFTDLHTIIDAENKNIRELPLDELSQVTTDIRACYMTMYKLAMQIHQTCSFPRKELKVHAKVRKQKSGLIRRAIRTVGTKNKVALKQLMESANDMQISASPKRRDSREHGALAGALQKFDDEMQKIERSIFRNVKTFFKIVSDRTKLRLWVTDKLLAWEDLLTEADDNFVSYVQETQQSERWADKIWLALEVPNSSRLGKLFSHSLLFMIAISVFVFLIETVKEFQPHSEQPYSFGGSKCERVTEIYCKEWHPEGHYPASNSVGWPPFPREFPYTAEPTQDFRLDPGCFVWDGTQTLWDQRLKFFCAEDEVEKNPRCYGHPGNFGSHSNSTPNALTCYGYDYEPTGAGQNATGLPRPFRTQQDIPTTGNSDRNKNALYDVCLRPECCADDCPEFYGSPGDNYDLRSLFYWMELVLAVFFTVEFLMRVVAARRIAHLFVDAFFLVDIGALAPFYVELFDRFVWSSNRSTELDFTIGPTDPPVLFVIKMLKVCRIFKMMRQYSSVSILWETIANSGRKLIIPFFFLLIIVICFGMLFFTGEERCACNPEPCPPGGLKEGAADGCILDNMLSEALQAPRAVQDALARDEMVCMTTDIARTTFPFCDDFITLGDEARGYIEAGFAVLVNNDGRPVDMTSAFKGIWLALVTMTSVGYGGISPSGTWNLGFASFAMLMGTFYLSMPLAIVGGEFYSCWKRQDETEHRLLSDVKTRVEDDEIKLAPEDAECVSRYKTLAYNFEVMALKLGQIGTSLNELKKNGAQPRLTIRRKTPVKSELKALMRNQSLKKGLQGALRSKGGEGSGGNDDGEGKGDADGNGDADAPSSKMSLLQRALSSRLLASPEPSPPVETRSLDVSSADQEVLNELVAVACSKQEELSPSAKDLLVREFGEQSEVELDQLARQHGRASRAFAANEAVAVKEIERLLREDLAAFRTRVRDQAGAGAGAGAASEAEPTQTPEQKLSDENMLASGRVKSSAGVAKLSKLDSSGLPESAEAKPEGGEEGVDGEGEEAWHKETRRANEHGSGHRRVTADLIVHGLQITTVDDKDNASIHEEFGSWIHDMMIEGYTLHSDIASVVLQVDQELLRMENTFDEFERDDD